MKNMRLLTLTMFYILLPHSSFGGLKHYLKTSTKGIIKGHTAGLLIVAGYLYCATEKMPPKQEAEIKRYVNQISPSFKDSRNWLHRLNVNHGITYRCLKQKESASLRGEQLLNHIHFAKDICSDSTESYITRILDKHTIAHEIAHYKHHSQFGYIPILGLLLKASKEKEEIEADLEAFKMMEQYDPETLDSYLHRVSLLATHPDPYLNRKENLFLWTWYTIEREKQNFNQSNFLNIYIQNRQRIKEELAKISKLETTDQTKNIVKKIIQK